MFQGGPLWYIRTRKLTRWQPPVLAIRRISAHVRCPEVTVMAQQTVPRKPTATATTSSLAFKSTSRWHTAVLYYYSMYLRRYLQAAHAHAHAWLLYNKCILLTSTVLQNGICEPGDRKFSSAGTCKKYRRTVCSGTAARRKIMKNMTYRVLDPGFTMHA